MRAWPLHWPVLLYREDFRLSRHTPPSHRTALFRRHACSFIRHHCCLWCIELVVLFSGEGFVELLVQRYAAGARNADCHLIKLYPLKPVALGLLSYAPNARMTYLYRYFLFQRNTRPVVSRFAVVFFRGEEFKIPFPSYCSVESPRVASANGLKQKH